MRRFHWPLNLRSCENIALADTGNKDAGFLQPLREKFALLSTSGNIFSVSVQGAHRLTLREVLVSYQWLWLIYSG